AKALQAVRDLQAAKALQAVRGLQAARDLQAARALREAKALKALKGLKVLKVENNLIYKAGTSTSAGFIFYMVLQNKIQPILTQST
ncbi:hypothetical protein, partial [Bacillus sp. AFS037270]|uniref:hypothetical protein n=2 Tax=unclassified Bacillus (in: firmicutes) TaxID=185979 RepID=UPI001C3F4944